MNEQSPAVVEASLLAALDGQDAIKDNYLNSFPLGSASSTMANWIRGLDQAIWIRNVAERDPIWDVAADGR